MWLLSFNPMRYGFLGLLDAEFVTFLSMIDCLFVKEISCYGMVTPGGWGVMSNSYFFCPDPWSTGHYSMAQLLSPGTTLREIGDGQSK